nr:replication protein A 70 kDa DNA-binding subunit B-like [Ipomoea batatas]
MKRETTIRSQECVFHDQQGMFIHVHIPKDLVGKYNDIFVEGNVLRNFLCITNVFKYKTSMLRYMIKFKHDTLVKEYKRVNFPKTMFRVLFLKLDVIGRVVEIYSPVEKVIAGKLSRLIDFVLEDTSSFDTTQLFFNHSCKEFIRDLRNSYNTKLTPLQCIQSGSRLWGANMDFSQGSNDLVVTQIEEIYSKKKDNYCKRKLIEKGGMMVCGGCKSSWQEGVVRYKLIVRVADDTRDAPMLIWDRECSDLVGVSASDLLAKYPEDFFSSDEEDCVAVEEVSQCSSLENVTGLEDFEEGFGVDGADVTLKRSLLKDFDRCGSSKKSKGIVVKEEK